MRILPDGANHAGSGTSETKAAAHRPRHRQCDAGQHLPMWNVSTNQNGYQTGGGGDGMNTVRLVDRRGFLVDVFSAGALILGTRAFSPAARAAQASVENATWHPNVFVGINPDGTVVLVAHRSEMGTGIRTALPMVLADELDADWSRVRIEQA